MLNFYSNKLCLLGMLLFFSTFLNVEIQAQCAGVSSTVSVCEKELDNGNQVYNLFNQLGGTPIPGGVWESENPFNNGALNEATGIVNLWAINAADIHVFTYSHPTCDTSTASVSVELGGYPGEDNTAGGANACQGDVVNLFSFLDSVSDNLNSDSNGTWEEVPTDATGNLSGEIFNTGQLDIGYYTFEYTVPAVGSCPSRTATVILEVHRIPLPGIPEDLFLCETDDLSSYSNLNLHTLLAGEDDNGIWSEMETTGQISSPTDSVIDLEEIYNLYGPGIYSFTYSVMSQQGVCPDQMATIVISIEKQLVLDGTMNIEDYCLGDGPPIVDVTYDQSLLDDGFYDVSVAISGGITSSATIGGVAFSNGAAQFTLPGTFPTNVDILVDITDMGPSNLCTSEVNMPTETFRVIEVVQPVITADDICFNEDTTVYLTNVVNSSLVLSDETYTIMYELTAPSGTGQILTTNDITFVNGDGSFIIDAALISEVGIYTITITQPFNFVTPCPIEDLETTFTVTEIPDDIELGLLIDNDCDATSVQVTVNAPQLNNGTYTVTYMVQELNSTDILTINTIVFTGGTAAYDINISTLPPGNYVVTVTSTQNDTTPCRTVFDFEESENFSINGIPDAPELDPSQSFCLMDFAPDVPKISDISVDSGDGLLWYDTANSTTPLDPSTPLIDGEDYYVTATDPINNCDSSDRSVVVVELIETSKPTTNNANPVFCIEDSPTVADLNAQGQNGGIIIWYTSLNDGTIVPLNTPLIDGVTYYATEQVGMCEHPERTQVTATVITVPEPTVVSIPQPCIIDSPTIADLENSITVASPFELVWYNAATGGTVLNTSDLLVAGTYYVSAIDPTYGCESDRVALSITTDNCDPVNYESLIPDGFSPNGDNVNDTYKLVNFEFIFPDYSIEIYNRYGKILFKGNNSTGPWNGKSDKGGLGNDIVPAGVYFYVVNFNRDNLPPTQGRLYLSR